MMWVSGSTLWGFLSIIKILCSKVSSGILRSAGGEVARLCTEWGFHDSRTCKKTFRMIKGESLENVLIEFVLCLKLINDSHIHKTSKGSLGCRENT